MTPTSYSRKLLIKYGIKKPIYPVTNGVDTDFFRADAGEGRCFREKYHISPDQKVVISAGHLIKRRRDGGYRCAGSARLRNSHCVKGYPGI